MNIRHIGISGAALTAGALALMTMTACGGPGTAAGAASNTPVTTTSGATQANQANQVDQADQSGPPANPNPGTGIGTGSPTVAGAARKPATVAGTRTPECKAANLKVTIAGSDTSMMQTHLLMRYANISNHSCVLVGFPGVSYVGGTDGHQVGAPAQRQGTIGRQVTVAPGQVASNTVTEVTAAVFDPAACRPTPVRGFRIYAPDDTASMFVPFSADGQGCAGTPPSAQLSVGPITAGAGDPTNP